MTYDQPLSHAQLHHHTKQRDDLSISEGGGLTSLLNAMIGKPCVNKISFANKTSLAKRTWIGQKGRILGDWLKDAVTDRQGGDMPPRFPAHGRSIIPALPRLTVVERHPSSEFTSHLNADASCSCNSSAAIRANHVVLMTFAPLIISEVGQSSFPTGSQHTRALVPRTGMSPPDAWTRNHR